MATLGNWGLILLRTPCDTGQMYLILTHLGMRRLGNVPTAFHPSVIEDCSWALTAVSSSMLLELEKALRQRETGA